MAEKSTPGSGMLVASTKTTNSGSLTSDPLFTGGGGGKHKQRKWEKEVHSGSRSFLASSTSRSSWLFGQTKAADNAGAAVLAAWSWGVMKGTGGGGGAVRMFMQDDCAQGRLGEGRGGSSQWADECKHRHTRWQSTSPEQQLTPVTSLPVICTILIKADLLDERLRVRDRKLMSWCAAEPMGSLRESSGSCTLFLCWFCVNYAWAE